MCSTSSSRRDHSLVHRAGRPKAGTDLVDVQRLLLAFPALKAADGSVAERLRHMGAPEAVLARWREIAVAPIEVTPRRETLEDLFMRRAL